MRQSPLLQSISTLCAGLALLLVVDFSLPTTEASTFSPTSEEALLTRSKQGAKLDLSTLTPHTENGRSFFQIDDMRYPIAAVQVDNAFTGNRWPGGVVYYQFDNGVSTTNRTAWRNAAAAWSSVASVSFVESTGSGNYVWVQNSNINNSYIGMIGGRQEMNIVSWSSRYSIAHEIGHALGLIHEHSRSNRDGYVTIFYGNIQAGQQSNFDIESGSVSYGPYDFDSVMHYSRLAFSSNGQNTIEPKPAYSMYLYTMGQTDHLSSQDIAGMVQRYGGGGSLSNDNFANRQLLTGAAGTVNGNNFGATSEGGEPAHAGVGAFASVWYSWTAPASGAITIDTIGSDFDTLLALYTGNNLNGLMMVASNDDIVYGVDVQSRVTFSAVAGVTYQIAVDGYNGDTGNIVLNWTGASAPAADYDHNGVSDILFQNNSTGQRAVWLMNGAAYSSGANLPSTAVAWAIVGSGDFNSDGKTDIVLQDYGTRQVSVWYMNNLLRTGTANLPSLPANWSVAATGDFNGDGKPDLALENLATGQHTLWLMNGVSRTSGVNLPAAAVQWKIVGTGDFNGDGKTDIVFQNYSTQQAAVWFMNGISYAGGAYLTTPASNWRIAGTGDFNRDGKPDLILQNLSTGQRALWLMNGVHLSSGGYLPTTPLQWDIRNR